MTTDDMIGASLATIAGEGETVTSDETGGMHTWISEDFSTEFKRVAMAIVSVGVSVVPDENLEKPGQISG